MSHLGGRIYDGNAAGGWRRDRAGVRGLTGLDRPRLLSMEADEAIMATTANADQPGARP